MDASVLKEKLNAIEERALALGFDGMGISPAEVHDQAQRFNEWLDKGYDGEMAWIKRGRDKRADLNLVLPGVQSVICLRTPYHTQVRELSFLDFAETGDISCYGWNVDYHDIITPRLKQLEAHLAELFPGCQTKSYVDTGPVLEKQLAQQAGLGWIGKHTNLLTEGMGSWYFLSEILIDVPLPLSSEAQDFCGPCRSCIDICPTQAIVAPYVLDARRCISYLTIELKGVIPLEFRRAIGNRIYGCDDCQIVCPWNEYATRTDEAAFQERDETRLLIDLMQLDDEGFRHRFRKSPVKRIKRRGLLRNVAIALGNSGSPEAVPILLDSLRDSEPLIRAHAVWALGELLQPAERQPVFNALADETAPEVLAERDLINTH